MKLSIKRIVLIFSDVVRSFFKDGCFDMAENVSFCALLAVIPMGMIMVSIVGYFLGGASGAVTDMMHVVSDIIPIGKEQFLANVSYVLSNRSSLGFFGILFLVFIAMILMASIERCFNSIFESEKKRNFFHSRLLGIIIIFWMTLLFSLPTMGRILEGLLRGHGFYFPLSDLMNGRLYFFGVAFLSYMMIIIIIPNRKVHIKHAVIGALFFTVGINVARFIFQSYMHFAVHRYNVIYGSLAAVITTVIWIYYLSVILLLSAEIVSVLNKRLVKSIKEGS